SAGWSGRRGRAEVRQRKRSGGRSPARAACVLPGAGGLAGAAGRRRRDNASRAGLPAGDVPGTLSSPLLLVRTEPGSQGLVGAGQKTLDRADRSAERGRDLLVSLAVLVLAFQQLADVLGQLRDARCQFPVQPLLLLDFFQTGRGVGSRDLL